MRPLRGERSEILELTEAVEPDGSMQAVGLGEPVWRRRPGWGNRHSPAELRELVRNRRVPIRQSCPSPSSTRERIVSSATSGAAATAFARLGAVSREARAEGELAIGAGDRTLEEIVRETLRPLLRAWLDDHLPGLVERLVREEIARVVSEAGLR